MNTVVELPNLLRSLSSRLSSDPDHDVVERALGALSPGTTPAETLDHAIGHVGLRMRWLRLDGAELASLARPDLPLVGVDPESGSWWMIDRGALGKVRVLSSAGGPARWVPQAKLPTAPPVRWGRVETLLPASPWASRPGKSKRPIERVLGLLQSEWKDVTVVVVYAVLVGVLSLATPLAIQVLINQLAFGVVLQPILFLGLTLLVCLALAAGLQIAKRYVVEVIQRRVFVRAVADLSARFTRVRIDQLDGLYAPELANRFFDVLTLQKATSTLLLDGTTAVLQALVGFSLLALYHPVLLLFDVFAVLLVGLVLFPLGRGAERTAIAESKAKYAVAGWLEEIARHPLLFKLGGGSLGERRADQLTRQYLAYRRDHFAVFFRQYSGMQVANVVLSVVLLVSCGWLVLEGQLTLGQLVAAEFIVASAITGVSKFTDKLETVYDLLAGIDKLGSLLDLEAERAGGRHRKERAHGASVRLSAVGYSGPGGGLAPLDLDVDAGAAVRVFGPAGAGKSTLAELLLGVRRPTSGTVLRDGMPVDSLAPEELFGEAMLLRVGEVVQGRLDDNLLMGRSHTPEALWTALEEVGIAGAVRALPKQLETMLGEKGQPLSDSQVLDLQVARALLASPRLVVVDGLFDGLEPGHRDRLFGALRRRASTLVVLTEDQSVAGGCDRTITLGGEA